MSSEVFELHKSPVRRFDEFESAQEFVGEKTFDTISTNLSRLQVSDEGQLTIGGKKPSVVGPVYDTFPGQLLRAAGLPIAVLHTHVSDEETRSYINEGLRSKENGRVVIQLMDGMPYQMVQLPEGAEVPALYDLVAFVEMVGKLAKQKALNWFHGMWDVRQFRVLLYSEQAEGFRVAKDDPYLIGLDVRNIFQRGVQVSGAIQRNSCTNSTILAGGEFIFREGLTPDPGTVLNSLRKWGEQFTVDMTSLGKEIKKLSKVKLTTENMTKVVGGVQKVSGRATAVKILSPFVKSENSHFDTDELGVIKLTRRHAQSSMYDVFNEVTERAQLMAARKRVNLEEFAYRLIGGELAGEWKVETPSTNGEEE